ncbi:hypothetical protein [Burkholderia phage vB_BglM_WTB]
MPINYEKCKRFEDTWAAPGSALYEAIEAGDLKKAKAIYDEANARQGIGDNKASKTKE